MRGKTDDDLWKKYEKRLEEELEIIKSMGFAGYFLIVSDFVNYAKKQEYSCWTRKRFRRGQSGSIHYRNNEYRSHSVWTIFRRDS